MNPYEKCGHFSDFQNCFRSFTADVLTVVADGIARVFNTSTAIHIVARDISKGF